MFGTGHDCAGPGCRSHRPPPDPRRQPARLQRQPDDRARHARTAAGAPGPRRQDRRDRSASQPDRRGGRRAPLHPPRDRRASAVRARARPVRGGTRRARRAAHRDDGRASRPCRTLAAPFTPEAAAAATGIDAEHDPPDRPRARECPTRRSVYGRIGTCTQEFGTLASWLVDVLNLLTGNLDREGGAMFPLGAAGHSNAAGAPWAAAAAPGSAAGRAASAGSTRSSASCPSPAWPRRSRRRARVRCGRWLRSAATRSSRRRTADRLDRALDKLELMVSVDVYVNETTRHADVILPAPSPLRRSHYDLALYLFAVRNVAQLLAAGAPRRPGAAGRVDHAAAADRQSRRVSGPTPMSRLIDEQVARALIQREVETEQSPVTRPRGRRRARAARAAHRARAAARPDAPDRPLRRGLRRRPATASRSTSSSRLRTASTSGR